MRRTARYLVALICVALAAGAGATDDMEQDAMQTDTAQFTTATYRVAVEKQEEFLQLLKGAEETMRAEGLITERPVFRMRSLEDPELLLEIFEWVDSEAFGRAQENPRVLSWWGKFEATWKEGGFGLSRFPEADRPWAQFESID